MSNKFSLFFKGIGSSMMKHSPEILTGIGIAGFFTTTILAVRATPKAVQLIKEEKYIRETDKLSPVDYIKATWKCYIPAAITGVLSTACICGATAENSRRNAALSAAYALAETGLKEYQEKVVETLGERKEEAIRDAIAKDRIEQHPIQGDTIIVTGKGNTLCYDAMFGKYFRSDVEQLKRIANDLNRRMRDEIYISLNDFYAEIGLDSIGIGDDIGWNIDRGYIDLKFSAQLTKDNEPCIVMDYYVVPRYGYSDFH